MRVIAVLFVLAAGPLGTAAAQSGDTPVPVQIEQAAIAPEWIGRVESALAAGNGTIEVMIEYAGSAPLALPGTNGPPRESQQSTQNNMAQTVRERLQSEGIQVVREYEYLPLLRARISSAQFDALRGDPDISNVFVEEFAARQEEALQATEEWSGRSLSVTAQALNADDVWNSGFTGENQTVVILDDGIHRDHSWFAGRIITEECFSSADGSSEESLCSGGGPTQSGLGAASNCQTENDVCGHGTHVAGIAAGNQGMGLNPLRGIAHGADIIPIQVFTRVRDTEACDEEESCVLSSNFDQLDALNWVIQNAATHNIAAVNMSLGGDEHSEACDGSNLLTSAINTLRSMGVATVIAAGNDGFEGAVNSPGCVSSAITVSGTILTTPSTSFNHAPLVDLLAPGIAVISAGAPPTSTAILSGTSMSTPHIAGAIALLKSIDPSVTVDQLEFALESTGDLRSLSSWTWQTPQPDLGAAAAALGVNPPFEGVTISGIVPTTSASDAP
ncbi:MAG: S8 family serine peptidase, partial [Rhodospirillaceae bacterium]